MLRIYCPVCNGLLELQEGNKRAVCKNCGRVLPVPQGYTQSESAYLFAAEAMQRRDYAAAASAYGDILAAHPDQAEAYFKRAVASYEVEYRKLSDGGWQLVCHQAQKSDFLQDGDVQQALALASGDQLADYQAQAQAIHELQRQVSAYAKSHPPVDVLLEAAGESLVSLDKAVQIRQLLEAANLAVFCPELDIPEGDPQAQEAALYRAASTAKAMVLVAAERSAFTEEINFDAERFLYRKEKAIRAAQGQIPTLLLAFAGLDEYEDIPDEIFDGIDQRLSMEQSSFGADLKAAVQEAMVLVAAERSAFTEEINFDAERFLYRKEKAIRAAQGQIPTLLLAFAGLDEYEDIPDEIFDGIDQRLSMEQSSFGADLKAAVQEAMADYRGALHEQAGTHENFAYANLLLQARQALESGDFQEAAKQYNAILLKSPTESQAYWGLLLAERECVSEQKLIESGKDITKESDYRNALAFASEREQQTYREVAAQIQEQAAVYAAQEKERKARERAEEEERRQKELEVEEAGRQKTAKEHRASRRRGRRMKVFARIVAVAAIAAGIGYFAWSKSEGGANAKLYKEAAAAYNEGAYEEAYQLYRDLGDYKDSEANAAVCLDNIKQDQYYAALSQYDDLSTRADAVSTIWSTKDYVADAANQLEDIRAEAEQYYAEGKLYEAWNTIRGFGEVNETYSQIYRAAFSRGVLDGGSNGRLIALTADCTILQGGITDPFPVEEGGAIAVALTDSGTTAGIVRKDGTAYLVNADGVTDLGWSNLVGIALDDADSAGDFLAELTPSLGAVAGLGADGSLYVRGKGKVASDIIQMDVEGSYVIGLKSDGSIYCSNPNAVIPSDWSDIGYVTMVGDGVLAVKNDGTLLQSGCEYNLADTGVQVVYHNGEDVALVRSKDGSTPDYFATYAAIPGVWSGTISQEGESLSADMRGTDEDTTAMRLSMKEMNGVDVPNPSAGESEGEE